MSSLSSLCPPGRQPSVDVIGDTDDITSLKRKNDVVDALSCFSGERYERISKFLHVLVPERTLRAVMVFDWLLWVGEERKSGGVEERRSRRVEEWKRGRELHI